MSKRSDKKVFFWYLVENIFHGHKKALPVVQSQFVVTIWATCQNSSSLREEHGAIIATVNIHNDYWFYNLDLHWFTTERQKTKTSKLKQDNLKTKSQVFYFCCYKSIEYSCINFVFVLQLTNIWSLWTVLLIWSKFHKPKCIIRTPQVWEIPYLTFQHRENDWIVFQMFIKTSPFHEYL